ncbi:MAG: hypothetical protein QOE11_878 [Solirubrobacteraceae bacterium]|jgi:hypothetical protein|nr:hypothetical protein [Solirubrobacteraceae bacterium]
MARKLVTALVVVVAAVGAVAVVGAVLAARDDATVKPSGGPGAPRATNASPKVAAGNVVLLYSDERLTSRLRALAADIGGPPDPALVAAGQAVILQRRPGLRVAVTAVTSARRLEAGDPGDPALRAFAEYWLGRHPA